MEQQIGQGIQNFLFTFYFCVYPSLSFWVFWCVCVVYEHVCKGVHTCVYVYRAERRTLASLSFIPNSSEARFLTVPGARLLSSKI